jgi:hypothetical protein
MTAEMAGSSVTAADNTLGSALRKGDARSTDLQQHQPQHQCAKSTSIPVISC